ncbi:histidine phosphatase family protein [Vallitalea okinawensis]|uniref:histidine phosphatase family protein n=1 Tax=Vallitalea okinawensis TaxID=2078660 RepID=UPI000CFAC1F1|nr:histidine phosphatase family protein [Vallitalea okinawensis]
MKEIILIQHCQSEHHINNLSGGWTDTPLTDLGRNQADLVGKALKEKIDSKEYTLISSDLLRASQTAEIVGQHLNLKVKTEFDLREINTGIAAWKTKDWVSENAAPMLEGSFDIDHRAFEEGETSRELYIRIVKCMERIYHKNEKNLVIVTHGCALSYIIGWWLKFTPEMFKEAIFTASPASISILRSSRYNQNALCLLNDRSHLMGLNHNG